MSYEEMTSVQLLDVALEKLESLEQDELTDEEEALLGNELNTIYFAIEKKVDSYDSFLNSLEEQTAKYEAAKQYYNQESARMLAKIRRIERIHDRFFKYIMPRVIETLGDGAKFETDINTFKFATKYSKLQIENPDLVPSRYKLPQPPKLDGRTARKDAIQAHKNGTKIEGMHVLQERYVKKS